MLECKLAQGKQPDVFVQDVKAAPERAEPLSVLFYDWQAVRFCTHNHYNYFSILTIDTTYNLGEFYLAPLTYHHLMLEEVRTEKHPITDGRSNARTSLFKIFNNQLLC